MFETATAWGVDVEERQMDSSNCHSFFLLITKQVFSANRWKVHSRNVADFPDALRVFTLNRRLDVKYFIFKWWLIELAV